MAEASNPDLPKGLFPDNSLSFKTYTSSFFRKFSDMQKNPLIKGRLCDPERTEYSDLLRYIIFCIDPKLKPSHPCYETKLIDISGYVVSSRLEIAVLTPPIMKSTRAIVAELAQTTTFLTDISYALLREW